MSICPNCGKPLRVPCPIKQVFPDAAAFVASATAERSKSFPVSAEWRSKVMAFAQQAQQGDVFAEYEWQAAPLMGGQGWYILRDGYVVAELGGWVS